MEEGVKIFWTGGYDSTYMLCRMARQSGLVVQPVYIKGDRPTREHELLAMQKILEKLRNYTFAGKIMGLETVEKAGIPPDDEIESALTYYRELEEFRNRGKLGKQYAFLARYAKDNGPIGLGLEMDPPGTVPESSVLAILNRGKLVRDESGYWCLDKARSAKNLRLLFGEMFFPIYDITEQEMEKDIHDWGLDEVMKEVWFCFSPIDGKPCGQCASCKEKINVGMGHLIPPERRM